VKFFLDTNVADDIPKLIRLRDALSWSHNAFVPMTVLAELLFRRRRLFRLNVPFDDEMIIQQLYEFSPFVTLPTTTVDDARRLAVTLHERYPTQDHWRRAKSWACTGDQNFVGGKRKSAHLDHHIAAWATADTPMITEERRGEWIVLPEGARFNVDEAIAKFGAPS
jgi:hypothetical protein